MKCPECGLVTFDDLPECPRCKESFALVRPLASSSLDGARHVLRDDPELRLKLRDRLHRARLDRRTRNDNPLATGPDPDAPDWFEPRLGGGNGDAETSMAPTPEAGERSEEREIVHSNDLSPEDDVRGGAATADADGEVDIIEASRESEDDEPEFNGDVPGFTDWREELRERLKRIRARREQERLAEEAAAAAEEEAAEAEGGEPVAEIEAADEQIDEPGAADEPDEDEEAAEAEAIEAAGEDGEEEEAAELELAEPADEDGEEQEAAELELVEDPEDEVEAAAGEAEGVEGADLPTAGDVIAKIIDGGDEAGGDADVDLEQPAASGDIDFTLAGHEAGDLDLAPDATEQHDEEGPEALILGEKEAEPSVPPEEAEAAEELNEADDEQVGEITAAELDEDETETEAETASDEDLDEIFAAEAELDEEDVALADAEAELDDEDEPAADASEEDQLTDDGELDVDAGEADIDISIEEPDEDLATEDAGPELDDWEIGSDAEETDEDLTTEEAESELVLEERDADDFEREPEAEEADLPVARMPAAESADAPELDFDPAQAVQAPEIDLPESEAVAPEPALEWDSEPADLGPAVKSSAGPLGERAAAALCDALVLTAIGAALVGAASSGAGVPFRQILVEEAVWLGLAWAIFAVGYSVFFVGSCGQTIGRMVMRLRVVGDDQFSVGFDRAAIRLAAWLMSALPALAGMLPALRDPQRRALHDRLSHTRVVKA